MTHGPAKRGLGGWLLHSWLLACVVPASAAEVIVNDSGDALHTTGCAATGTGTCTLRDAITFANANLGPDVIRVVPAGVFLRPTSALPAITERAILDASSPLGLFPNILDGGLAGPADGLVLAADQITVYGLVVREFAGSGIVIQGSNAVVGAFLPCPLGGCSDLHVETIGNGQHGIEIRAGTNSSLATFSAVANGGSGVFIHGGAASAHVGSNPIPPYRTSVNIVANNRVAGVRIGDGPADAGTKGHTIDLGLLYSNGGVDIDLGGDGPTANDLLDADAGPNGLQNFPTVTSAVTNADNTATVSGSFSGAPSATFALRFHRADTGEAAFMDDATITADGGGASAWTAILHLPSPTPPPAGVSLPLVATATNASGDTSELSGKVTAPLASGLAFHTLSPCRVLDTREATAAGGAALHHLRSRVVTPRGTCGVPTEARALSLNVTVTGPTTDGHVLVAGSPGASDASTLNFRAGQTRANGAVVALGPRGLLTATAVLAGAGAVDIILDVNGYFQ